MAALVVVLGGVGTAIALSGSGAPAHKARHVAVAAYFTAGNCPLTDLPPAGGKVPNRPAIAVKVGNEPLGARPQSGLGEADIVYDTPAEGFIMRYVAVFQCTSASSIGPTRSVRWVDSRILNAFGRPILGFAGGIIPDVQAVDQLGWLQPANLLAGAFAAGHRISTRVPPDNLYTSTSALAAVYPKDATAPRPVFQYSATMPVGATPIMSFAINFSAGTDVVWKWDPTNGVFVHTYSGVPDIDALTNEPVTTTNIVVQVVHYKYGPFAESTGSTGDVESQTVGTGTGYVLRGGREISVTWHRPSLTSPTTFTTPAGKLVTLAPGRTFVELVPDTTAAGAGAITMTH